MRFPRDVFSNSPDAAVRRRAGVRGLAAKTAGPENPPFSGPEAAKFPILENRHFRTSRTAQERPRGNAAAGSSSRSSISLGASPGLGAAMSGHPRTVASPNVRVRRREARADEGRPIALVVRELVLPAPVARNASNNVLAFSKSSHAVGPASSACIGAANPQFFGTGCNCLALENSPAWAASSQARPVAGRTAT